MRNDLISCMHIDLDEMYRTVTIPCDLDLDFSYPCHGFTYFSLDTKAISWLMDQCWLSIWDQYFGWSIHFSLEFALQSSHTVFNSFFSIIIKPFRDKTAWIVLDIIKFIQRTTKCFSITWIYVSNNYRHAVPFPCNISFIRACPPAAPCPSTMPHPWPCGPQSHPSPHLPFPSYHPLRYLHCQSTRKKKR